MTVLVWAVLLLGHCVALAATPGDMARHQSSAKLERLEQSIAREENAASTNAATVEQAGR